ncbi:MAG: primosomal protein N' [Clostridiales bacterium GWF2_36_10]|nr:MAG: primosomal protein N' [Clostridiales bacterium GWF2_36_10]HAN20809.1 primosomal protein N' [Clostridiales bacterium]
MEKIYAAVYILDISYRIDRRYVYFIPPDMRQHIQKGSLCVVPFGNANKQKSAVVVDFSETIDFAGIKPLSSIMDYPIEISDELVDLCVFMKERFLCSFGNAMKTVLPPGVNFGTSVYYTVAVDELPEGYNTVSEVLFRYIKTKKKAYEKYIYSEYSEDSEKLLKTLVKNGILEKQSEVAERINEKNVKLVRLLIDNEQAEQLLDSEGKITDKQKELVNLLLHYPKISVSEIEEISGLSSSVISTLTKKGICERYEDRIERAPYEDSTFEISNDVIESNLSEEQTQAVETLNTLVASGKPKAALLFGVTGSGKTKVIIETVKKALSLGRTAIILIPEIGLTAQALSAYKAVFGKRLAVIHSMLSVGERVDTYRRITGGDISVVLGTRSAVFAPLKNIGVIVMDEEQESTYKSELTPKYHARDIVRFRCSKNNSLMLLASATPSIESFYKAKSGVYTLIKLTERYGGLQLPKVLIEDLRNDEKTFPDKLIGTLLEKETKNNIDNKEQTIMFANRRGYNSYLSCRSCGMVYTCPNCSVSLTYHAYNGSERRERLACHYCGYVCEPPKICSACGSKHIGFFGFGTQKLQDEITERFADSKFIRMDTDTTSARYAHDKMLKSFGDGEADILFGTQMVAKGLDFAGVSLVGVISVDTLLYMNDFRAGERTFSLITQLVGRAGRAKKQGRAVLQTYNPDNEILKLAATQDYEKFYESEIKLRKAVQFPPFCSVAVFGISGENESSVWEFAKQFDTTLDETHRKSHSGVKIQRFGPFKDGIYKMGGRYRQRIIIKYADNPASRAFLNDVYSVSLAKLPNGIKLDIDINPAII